MYFLYSIAYTLGFILMLPAFLLNRQKYTSGFSQRLGNYPEFKHDDRKVIWLHCVSVGETNAARPLVDRLREEFHDHRLVISTTTKTGQELANKIFADRVDSVFYFPLDWKFSVRKALAAYKPSLVLLMETEIWPRFIREAKLSRSQVAIVNGRLSENSFRRYSQIRPFIKSVLANVDFALMQTSEDRERIEKLGVNPTKARVTGNLKFDHNIDQDGTSLITELVERFGKFKERPLIIAASTHEPEEKLVLEAFAKLRDQMSPTRPRLMLVPRHPERFDAVAEMLGETRFQWVRRSATPSSHDKTADIILLDSIGELAAVYYLGDLIFVGGSLIPHGGQSILEPAVAGKAIVTGPYTHNFDAVIKEFLANKSLVQLPESPEAHQIPERLYELLYQLLQDENMRDRLGKNAAAVMNANRGATAKTIEFLKAFSKQLIADNE